MGNLKPIHAAAARIVFAALLTLYVLAAAFTATFAQGGGSWVRVGTGDHPGQDVDSSEGAVPDPRKARTGYTAFCWDGIQYNNKYNPGRAFCTYKNLPFDKIAGGTNIGVMYKGVGPGSPASGRLVSFISGPDPEGITPVYYLGGDGQLHHVQSTSIAAKWFGADWISQIRWCGDSQRRILPQCRGDFSRLRGCPITDLTTQLP
jgi:hypothetical protein